jgi:hypothetical protein
MEPEHRDDRDPGDEEHQAEGDDRTDVHLIIAPRLGGCFALFRPAPVPLRSCPWRHEGDAAQPGARHPSLSGHVRGGMRATPRSLASGTRPSQVMSVAA